MKFLHISSNIEPGYIRSKPDPMPMRAYYTNSTYLIKLYTCMKHYNNSRYTTTLLTDEIPILMSFIFIRSNLYVIEMMKRSKLSTKYFYECRIFIRSMVTLVRANTLYECRMLNSTKYH